VAAYGKESHNIAQFVKEFNERTAKEAGMIIPVIITIFADRTYTFITKTPPVPVLLKKACNIESGSGKPNKDKVAKIPFSECRKIAQIKLVDTNASDVESCARMVAGTARSMGIVVTED
jgi:large subunit ribosomal protein L11